MRTGDGLIHFERSGKGQPLVLIHGVGSSLQGWDEVSAALEAEFDILRLDLRGHGRSAEISGPYSIDAFAADVITVLDEAGVARADLVGFSLGGLIAQRLAVGWPQRFNRIVLLSAVAGRTAEEREKVVARLDMIRKGGIETILGAAHERWFTANFARAHPDVIEARMDELRQVHLPSYLEAYRVFGQTELVDTRGAITHPTLVMTGEFDQGSNVRMAETMHRLIPNSELRILPGLKHSVLVEASQLIADHVREFLKRQNDTKGKPMNEHLYERGLERRKATLGADYVDNAMSKSTAFSKGFQSFITEYCWGAAWGDDRLDAKTRSMLNIVMIAALNRMHEWELHFRGALRNGVTRDELDALITHLTVYCGVPTGVECHRIANRVFAELADKEPAA